MKPGRMAQRVGGSLLLVVLCVLLLVWQPLSLGIVRSTTATSG